MPLRLRKDGGSISPVEVGVAVEGSVVRITSAIATLSNGDESLISAVNLSLENDEVHIYSSSRLDSSMESPFLHPFTSPSSLTPISLSLLILWFELTCL